MRTGPRDVLLLALARPTVNIDTDDIITRRQSQKRLAPPIVLRVTTTTTPNPEELALKLPKFVFGFFLCTEPNGKSTGLF